MALTGSYKSAMGDTHAEAYIKIDETTVPQTVRMSTMQVQAYKDEATRTAGGDAEVKHMTVPVAEGGRDKYVEIELTTAQKEALLAAAYARIKTVAPYDTLEDTDPL